MPSQTIQWFPGHMAKTRRMITDNVKNVDLFIEMLDARIPLSSRNPDIDKLRQDKPVLMLLNKASLADPTQNTAFLKHYASRTSRAILCDCNTGVGLDRIAPTVRELLSDKLAKFDEKGQSGRHVRAIVVGIPNVGKSTLINRLSGKSKLKTENRPGVTRDKQWVSTMLGIDLLDMPGILWPKFADRLIGENLALTGAIKDDVLDITELGLIGVRRMRTLYPSLFSERYRIPLDVTESPDVTDLDLLTQLGKNRGCLISGGEIDYERASNMLIDEIRGGKIGKITLDRLAKTTGDTTNAQF